MAPVDETDEEKVKKCIKDAGMSKNVKKLKDGINTEVLKVIYDEGVDFSGGEKQKLALARALYKTVPLWCLMNLRLLLTLSPKLSFTKTLTGSYPGKLPFI